MNRFLQSLIAALLVVSGFAPPSFVTIATGALAISAAAAPAQAHASRLKVKLRHPSVDPATITTLGLGTVYHLDSNGLAGLSNSSATFKTPASNLATWCGAGCAIDSSVFLNITQSKTLTDVDFSGYQVFIDGAVTVDCTNCKLRGFANSGAALSIGSVSGNPSFACHYCDVDGSVQNTNYEAPVTTAGSGTIGFDHTKFHDTTMGYLSLGGTGTVTLSYIWFDACGIGADFDDHCENIHAYQGTVNGDHMLFNWTGGAGRVTGGVTGMIFPESYAVAGATVPVVVTIDTSVFIGVSTVSNNPSCGGCTPFTGLLYPFQLRPRQLDATLNVTNSAIEKGSSGYIGVASPEAGTPHYDPTGSLRYNTGAAVTFP